MNMNRAREVTYFLLRVVAGFMFFQAGSMILFGWFGGMPGPPGSTPPLMSELGIGGGLEFLGGLAILLGLFTRPVAFILSGEMAVAYWQFHAPNGLWPVQNQGMPAILFCFIYLYGGAGRRRLESRRSAPTPARGGPKRDRPSRLSRLDAVGVGRDRPIPPFHRGRRGTATPPYKAAPDIPWNCVRHAPRLHESSSGH